MASDAIGGLERHDPRRWRGAFGYRTRAELPYDLSAVDPAATLMLDATVYIDSHKAGHLPPDLRTRIAMAPIVHSAVVVGELAAGVAILDPGHPATPRVRTEIEATLRQMPSERILAPSADAWAEASVIAGVLARTQSLGQPARRKLLNDALLFLGASEAGAVLVSRNKSDVDLLLRFRPDVAVLLYDRPAKPGASGDEA